MATVRSSTGTYKVTLWLLPVSVHVGWVPSIRCTIFVAASTREPPMSITGRVRNVLCAHLGNANAIDAPTHFVTGLLGWSTGHAGDPRRRRPPAYNLI
jgi:hypothetical protein